MSHGSGGGALGIFSISFGAGSEGLGAESLVLVSYIHRARLIRGLFAAAF